MDNITAVVPTSAIKSHPDTAIIDETIKSIRHHLPNCEIILTFDGLHSDYSEYEDRYNEYKNRMLWKCLHEYKNVLPLIMSEHEHQSGMMYEALPHINTDLILYVEQDTPIYIDREIDWKSCIKLIETGEAYCIRFNHEEQILKPHEHLVVGDLDAEFIKTIQWSQRPHLTSVVYYKNEVMRHFPRDGRTFIEDVMHSIVQNDYNDNGLQGWYKHRLHVYNKKDKLGHKRSYHTDGREGDEKVGEGLNVS